MADREWAAGDGFSLADCGAAPFLLYAGRAHRIDPSFANVIAYHSGCRRLRPSRARSSRRDRITVTFRSAHPIAIDALPQTGNPA